MDAFTMLKTVPITEMADRIGLNYTERMGKATANCPFCKDETGHLYLYSDSNRYHCFKCQASGDSIDLAIKGFNYSIGALKDLFGYNTPTTARSCTSEPVWKPKIDGTQPEPVQRADYSNLYYEITATLDLSTAGREYLTHRGLTDEIIERYSLKSIDEPKAFFNSLMERYSQDDLLAAGLIDYNKNGKLYGSFFMPAILFSHLSSNTRRITSLSTRNLAGDAKSFKLHGIPSAYYYGLDAHQAKEIFVFEGIIDGLSYSIMAHKDNFISLNGLLTPSQYDNLKQAHPNQKLILGLDPDEAGQEALSRIKQCDYINWTAFAIQLGFKGLQKHENGKPWDMNDYLVHLHQLTEELIGCYGITEDDALVAALKHFQDSTKEKKA